MDHLEGRVADLADLQGEYLRGLEAYKSRDWESAIRFFGKSAAMTETESLSRLYLSRCEHFLDEPPSKDWDGVWTMTTK